MKKKQYSDELKELIIKECQETGNVALVARRHEMSPNTIHTWLSKYRKNGSVKTMPKAKDDRQKALEELIILCELGEEVDDQAVASEVEEGLAALRQRIEEMELAVLLNGPYDRGNAILSLHAGAGGTEAQDWAEMLLRMYSRWAERHQYKVEILDLLPGDEAGTKSATIEISGPNAYGYLKSERGVHRLVRISPFDTAGRRHTSFASVDVLPQLEDDVEVQINPGSGQKPGPQRSSSLPLPQLHPP
jgi:protein subunit release factor A